MGSATRNRVQIVHSLFSATHCIVSWRLCNLRPQFSGACSLAFSILVLVFYDFVSEGRKLCVSTSLGVMKWRMALMVFVMLINVHSTKHGSLIFRIINFMSCHLLGNSAIYMVYEPENLSVADSKLWWIAFHPLHLSGSERYVMNFPLSLQHIKCWLQESSFIWIGYYTETQRPLEWLLYDLMLKSKPHWFKNVYYYWSITFSVNIQ